MEDVTIGVCGFSRCGATMVMRMLDAGGVRPVDGTMDGSYEAAGPLDWDAPLAGCTVKLLDSIKHGELPPANWRFIWVDRDPNAQTLSTRKFRRLILEDLAPIDDLRTEITQAAHHTNRLAADRPKVLAKYRTLGPVTVVHFERILANPIKAAKQLRKIAPGLDVHAAAAVVLVRGPECLPDVAIEEGTWPMEVDVDE